MRASISFSFIQMTVVAKKKKENPKPQKKLKPKKKLVRKPKALKNVHAVYLLQRTDGKRTYIGYTVDIKTRLRKHNGLIKGGAKSTRKNEYKLLCIVWPFPSKVVALRFEWAWKRRFALKEKKSLKLKTFKRPMKKAIPYGVMGRYEKLEQLLCMRYWTKKCDPTENLDTTLNVTWLMKDDPRPQMSKKWIFNLSSYQKQYRCPVSHTFGHESVDKIFDLMYDL